MEFVDKWLTITGSRSETPPFFVENGEKLCKSDVHKKIHMFSRKKCE